MPHNRKEFPSSVIEDCLIKNYSCSELIEILNYPATESSIIDYLCEIKKHQIQDALCDLVNHFLSQGHDLQNVKIENASLLYWACFFDSPNAISLLEENQFNLHIDLGMEELNEYEEMTSRQSSFYIAVVKNSLNSLTKLGELGCRFNDDIGHENYDDSLNLSERMSSFYCAIQKNASEIVTIFLKYGYDFNTDFGEEKYDSGEISVKYPFLYTCVENKSKEALQAVLPFNYKLESNKHIEYFDEYGEKKGTYSVLFEFIQKSSVENVRFLGETNYNFTDDVCIEDYTEEQTQQLKFSLYSQRNHSTEMKELFKKYASNRLCVTAP
ncbi:hypothetical protein HOG98_00445 [bacterium]|nr:hypothetical protein [bacterium]